MAVYRIECTNCGEIRVGREQGDNVIPIEAACLDCTSLEFTIVA